MPSERLAAVTQRLAALPRQLASTVRSWSPRRRAAVGGATAVVLVGAIVAGVLLSSGSPPPKQAAASTSTTAKSQLTNHPKHGKHHKPAHKVHVPPFCPLTGVRPPGGKVPQREVLAVKVGNNPTARPQSGLQQADIVYDTLAEGGITRYIAVYQCGNASSVGPIRSVRWDDWHVLGQYGHAALAYVGGVDPNRHTVASLSWICNLDDFVRPGLYHQDPYRVRPDATYSSTATLRSVCPGRAPPPVPWQYSKAPQAGSSPVVQAEIPYSPYADVIWRWSTRLHAFVHAYREGGIVPDIDADGVQLHADNVLIQMVAIEYGPYVETPGSTGDVEAQVVGHGKAYLLRDGRLVQGTWSRGRYGQLTRFTTAKGKQFLFDPGNTWVELVPDGLPLSFTH